MPHTSCQSCESCRNCGADPLDPLLANESDSYTRQQADGGVGCGPGGPPHNQCRLSSTGKSMRHWTFSLPRPDESRRGRQECLRHGAKSPNVKSFLRGPLAGMVSESYRFGEDPVADVGMDRAAFDHVDLSP